MNYIELKDIHKKYNIHTSAEVYALRGINLTIDKGESLAIIGPSGSGKSSLLHILGCIDKSTSGTYLLEGHDVRDATNNHLAYIRNKKIGFVLQEFGLLLNQTALENVSIPLFFSKVKLKNIKRISKETLESLNIGHLSSKKANELSGGQKQRVAIARALVTNPDIILADEPTGALDQSTSKDIMNLLLDLNKKGKTLVIVTHNMEIASMCNRIINITDGIIL